MSDYVVKFTGKDDLSNTVKNIKKELGDIGTTGKTAMDKIDAKFQKITQSTAPLKRQLRDLQNLMTEMNFKGMSNTPEFTKIAQEAGKIKDAMNDAATAVSKFSHDTMGLQAAIQAFQGIAAAGSVATGVMAMFGTENQQMVNAIRRTQAALSILNGLQSLANALNKDSALILKLKQIQQSNNTKTTLVNTIATQANTGATNANTTAVETNTAAQKAANTVISTGKNLLGTFSGVLLLATAAYSAYQIATAKSKEMQEQENQATQRAKEVHDSYLSTLSSTYANLMTKYTQLQAEYKKLRTEHEKNEWIKNNKSALDELYISTESVRAVDKAMIDDTDNIVEAFKARAKAAALAAEMQARYSNQIKLIEQRDDLSKYLRDNKEEYDRIKKNYNEGKGYTWSEAKFLRNYEKQRELLYGTATEIGKNETGIDSLANNMGELQGKIKTTTPTKITPKSSGGGRNTTTTNTTPELPKYAVGSLSDLEHQVSDLQQQLKDGLIPSDKVNETNTEITELKEKIQKMKIELGFETDPNIKSIENIKDKIKNDVEKLMQEEIPTSINTTNSSFDTAMGVNQFDTSTLQGIERVMDLNDNLISGLENTRDNLEMVLLQMAAVGDIGSESWNKVYDKLNQVNEKIVKTGENQVELTNKAKDLKQAEKIDEERVKTLNRISDAAQNAGNMISSMASVSDDKGTKTAMIIAEAIANIVAGYASASAQAGGTLGPWGWAAFSLAGLAQVAAMISQIHSLSGYAEGGVISGGSTHGDNILARVNAGEMILNPRQQSNLFKAIDNGSLDFGGGSNSFYVDWRIKGSDLYGTMKNYSKTVAKTGKNTGIR